MELQYFLDLMQQDTLTIIALPLFLLAIIAEVIIDRKKHLDLYYGKDTLASFWMLIFTGIIEFVPKLLAFIAFYYLHEISPLRDIVQRQWWAWTLLFFLDDFTYYWFHRLNHEVRLFWAGHVPHHSSVKLNLGTALRQGVGERIHKFFFWLWLPLLGFDPLMMFIVISINLFYQFWVHTQHIPELGWLEWLLVTPSNHRVHHAQNDCYLDRNYGGVFIVWDRLFGSYQRELADEPCVYGIRGAIRSWNPLVALTHIYRDMLNDMLRTGSGRDRWRVLWARTGWQPEDVRARWPREKSDLADFSRFDPEVSTARQWYGGVQLLGATALLIWGQLTPLSDATAWLWWLLLVWTGVATAGWLHGQPTRLMLWLDVPRLAGVAAAILATPLGAGWTVFAVLWLLWSLLLVARETAAAMPESPASA